jgi:hypothetical protein
MEFHNNLQKVKVAMKKWASTFFLYSQVTLKETNLKISSLYGANDVGTFYNEEYTSLEILLEQI